MLRLRLKILWCVLALLTPGPLPLIAETQPGTRVLELKLPELEKEAVENNSELKAMEHDVEIKRAGIGPARAYEDPLLGIEAMNFPVDTLSASQFAMTGVQVSLTQKIPFPGKLSRLGLAAEKEYEAQSADVEQKRFVVVREVKKTFFDLYRIHRKKQILLDQKNLLERTLVATRNNYTVGRATQAEVVTLQVEHANYLDQLLSADRELREKLGELNHLLGKFDHKHYTSVTPIAPLRTALDVTKLDEEQIVRKVLSRSPQLRAFEKQAGAAEQRFSYAKWNYLPDLEFKLGYTFRKPSPGDSGTNFVSGMVALSLPIWAFEKQSEQVEGARAGVAKARALLTEKKNALSHDIHTALAELVEASERLKLLESGVLPLTRQAIVVGQSAYATGKLDYASFINLVNRHFQSENSYVEAFSAYETRIADLEALAGISVEAL